MDKVLWNNDFSFKNRNILNLSKFSKQALMEFQSTREKVILMKIFNIDNTFFLFIEIIRKI